MNEAQALILENLAEECAEVIQAKSKIVRFGFHDYHPKHTNKTNEQLLIDEIADVLVCFEALEFDPFIWSEYIEDRMQIKRQKLVNRHPEVFAPIFNMRPTNEVVAEFQQLMDTPNVIDANNPPDGSFTFPGNVSIASPEFQEEYSIGGVSGRIYKKHKTRYGYCWNMLSDNFGGLG